MKLSWRSFFPVLFSVFSLLAAANIEAAEKKPNVLFIAVDDLNNNLGCYGHPLVKSPNIDKLAQQGVRFDRAYCNYALCNPSRTSLLSGRRPETTGIMDNETHPRTFFGKNVKFLPEYFRANGYFTARVGKILHSTFEDACSWNISEGAKGKKEKNEKGDCDPTWETWNDSGKSGGSPVSFCATSNDDADEPDGRTARRIAELIEQHKSEPFFIAAGFHKPHEPLVCPKKYFDLYDWRKIELTREPANDRGDIPSLSLERNRPDPIVTEDRRKQAMAAYYATISFMDAQVGVILDKLDKLGLRENTVVILFGDHGWHLGEHQGLWRKTTLFYEADRAPLIIHAPGMKGNGKSCPRTAEFIDIYPTLVDLCGLPENKELHGKSMKPLLENVNTSWKPAFTVLRWGNDLGKVVSTERWRYAEWNQGRSGSELYDLEKDPFEFTNLAKEQKFATVVQEMKGLLAKETAAVNYVPPSDRPGKKKKK